MDKQSDILNTAQKYLGNGLSDWAGDKAGRVLGTMQNWFKPNLVSGVGYGGRVVSKAPRAAIGNPELEKRMATSMHPSNLAKTSMEMGFIDGYLGKMSQEFPLFSSKSLPGYTAPSESTSTDTGRGLSDMWDKWEKTRQTQPITPTKTTPTVPPPVKAPTTPKNGVGDWMKGGSGAPKAVPSITPSLKRMVTDVGLVKAAAAVVVNARQVPKTNDVNPIAEPNIPPIVNDGRRGMAPVKQDPGPKPGGVAIIKRKEDTPPLTQAQRFDMDPANKLTSMQQQYPGPTQTYPQQQYPGPTQTYPPQQQQQGRTVQAYNRSTGQYQTIPEPNYTRTLIRDTGADGRVRNYGR